MGVRLVWTDTSYGEEGHKVYRSESPMNPLSLPAPLITLGPNITLYDDGSAAADTLYYYRVSAYIGATEEVSDEVSITTTSWSPAELFTGAEDGAWYDPSDLTTLFQDSAGTTPVTADGDSVGLMQDKSGNGNHASQPTAVQRPTYKTDGTLHWLQPDGTNDRMDVAGNAFSLPALTAYIAVRAVADNQRVIDARGTGSLGSAKGWQMKTRTLSTTGVIAIDDGAAHYFSWETGMTMTTGVGHVAGFKYQSSSGSAWLDGTLKTPDSSSGSMTSIVSTVQSRLFAASNDASQLFSGRFHGGVITSQIISEATRAKLETWLGDKAGIIL